MRKLILIALAATCTLTLCAAKEYEWPQLPEGTLPDSEVSTNVTLHVNMSRLDEFSLCIEAANCVSGSVLAMQGRSRVWHGPCDGGYAICWENVFLGGDTNAATNLHIVMRDNGWFETWSNEVGRVYKRINPYDWDGDGLDNTIDSAPKTYDGYCFGTGVDWLNANCGAILSASLDADDAMRIDWNPNSGENAAPRGPGSDFDIERPLDFTMSDGESGGHISTVPVSAFLESV